jgi:hypothetical protein
MVVRDRKGVARVDRRPGPVDQAIHRFLTSAEIWEYDSRQMKNGF